MLLSRRIFITGFFILVFFTSGALLNYKIAVEQLDFKHFVGKNIRFSWDHIPIDKVDDKNISLWLDTQKTLNGTGILILEWPYKNEESINDPVATKPFCGNCFYTNNINYVNEARAILFSGLDTLKYLKDVSVNGQTRAIQLPRNDETRKKEQYWVWKSYESPIIFTEYLKNNNAFSELNFDSAFNLTMTYRRDSNIYHNPWGGTGQNLIKRKNQGYNLKFHADSHAEFVHPHADQL